MTDVTGSAGVISFDSALVCSVLGWTSRSMNEAPGAVERFLSTVLLVVVASVVAVVASNLVVVASGRIGLFLVGVSRLARGASCFLQVLCVCDRVFVLVPLHDGRYGFGLSLDWKDGVGKGLVGK